ncbi:glycosyltransferase [Bacillus salitolerans]|uniref:Glycosyltransferase n=1 Tax=Bacillus salitolerans TaxID=1437434 RepID=A0ABW4LRR9_9BACI
MKKILFFPLLDSLPSGHHQVANSVMNYVSSRSTDIQCKKIDLLNRWNPHLESMITKTYLGWIQKFPESYAWIYRKLAYKSKQNRSYKHYEMLFQHKMEEIIMEEKPDLIICTHAFPSYLLNRLKQYGACDVPVVNIYTDFFVNDVWGKEMIEYHFVSDIRMKNQLMEEFHIPANKIKVTGIPVDESFSSPSSRKKEEHPITILLSGGSAGLGNIMELLTKVKKDGQLTFKVLCGNNHSLFQEVSNLNNPNIQPLPYISSRSEMNKWYDLADAIITKPGGVTISESLKKKVPIFIHSVLPGQEEINLQYLRKQGLVFTIRDTIELLDLLSNKQVMKEYEQSLYRYRNTQDFQDPEEIFIFLESLVNKRDQRRQINQIIEKKMMKIMGGVSGD